MNDPADTLARFVNNEATGASGAYSPATIGELLERLGNPHRRLPCVHIAGTNGKGSTAHMTDSILRAAGYHVGLYTSPHLLRINERLRIDGREIDDRDLGAVIDEAADAAGRAPALHPTYFDVLTAAAFLHFARARVDLAVIEVGLGGRLDSTNIIVPRCSIITAISRDHAHILGDTLAAIASEKAGIIKPGVPVVCASQPPPVLSVIADCCRKNEAPAFLEGPDFSASIRIERPEGLVIDYLGKSRLSAAMDQMTIPFHLACQVQNAALAISAALLLRVEFSAISDGAISAGLASTRVPGRLETWSTDPPILFDPAHNPAAMAILADHLDRRYAGHQQCVVLSLMKDKDVHAILEILRSPRRKLIYHQLDDERAFIPGGDEEHFFSNIRHNELELRQILCTHYYAGAVLCFTGSFRLYGAAREMVASITGKPFAIQAIP